MAIFLMADRLGVHVLPKHYYTPVQDVHWLRTNRDAWTAPAQLEPIGWDLDEQLAWLSKICLPYYGEVEGLGVYDRTRSAGAGPGYGAIESQVLHCFLRTFRPPRIVEIGSGMSTYLMLHASDLNVRDDHPASQITCVEPFPSELLKAESRVHLFAQPAQSVDVSVFAELCAGDFLFIDSTHVVKTGSDLIRIYLDIVPRLAPGVFVHVHDIFLPYLYPRRILRSYFDWQESALLLALLIGNERLRVVSCLSALHYGRVEGMGRILGDYCPQANDEGLAPLRTKGHFPSSLYLVTA